MKSHNEHRKFWDREYKQPTHLALSTEPSEDLLKFTRWIERQYGGRVFNPTINVVDLGCGNGRNLVFLAKHYHCRGVGYDISTEAIKQAKELGKGLPLTWTVQSLDEPVAEKDNSVQLVLDMMSSHILKRFEREKLRAEILRILRPGGWLFFKSFLLEDDDHAKRLIKERPADELHSYLHPELGVYEHVWTIPELEQFFEPYFIIHKIEKSHKHRSRGRAFRRRTVSVYLEKRA